MAQGSVEVPYALALVVADGIHRDHGNGKLTILGTFAHIASTAFPCIHPQLGVYIALTNGRGKGTVTLRLCDVDEEKEPLFQDRLPVEFISPLAVLELTAVIGGVRFETPGDYRLQLFANDTFLMERRIVVTGIGESKHDDTNADNAGDSTPNA